VRLVTGAPAIDLVHGVVSAIADSDLASGLSTVKTATSQNIDMSVFLKLILHTVRAVLLARFGAAQLIKEDLTSHEFAFVTSLAKKE